MPYYREDQAHITLKVGTKVYADSWKTFSGGDLTADTQKTRPGGMGDEVDVGGEASRGDVTITRQMTDITAGWKGELEDAVGVAEALVTVKLLNRDKTASVNTETYSGTLKGVNPPDRGGGSAVTMLTVVIGCHEKSPAGG